jgi:cell division protein FtsZ
MNITSGPDLGIDEVSEAAGIVSEAAHDDVHVIFGTVCDESAGDEIRITVIATGIDSLHAAPPVQSKAATVMPLRGGPTSVPPSPQPGPRSPHGLNTVDVSLQQAVSRQASPQQGNFNVPAYLRKPSAPAANPPRAGGHNPGEDDFIFDEDEFETPSFIRKQAN